MTTMSAKRPAGARQALLRDILARTGFVSVAQIADDLQVSEMTIRRDLKALERQGVVVRMHGGAMSRQDPQTRAIDVEEPSFNARSRRNAAAKARIGRTAARLIAPGETIGLDVGTSACQLAHCLSPSARLKVFTNNLRAALLLGDSPHRVYLPGGEVRSSEMSVFGPIAVAQLRHYWLDHVFIGVSGLTASGCYDYSLEDTEVKRVYMERASQVVVLCDSSKFSRMSVVRICELGQIDVLVTDAPPEAELARALHDAEVRIVIADPG